MSNVFFFFGWGLLVAHLATSQTTNPDVLNGAFIRIVVPEALPWKFD